MVSFDTTTFWLFFAVAWAVWRFVPFGAAKSLTLCLSLFFYAWWNPWFVLLIASSAVIDYVAGGRIHAAPDGATRRAWLVLSLCTNLGLLAVFKYGPFAVQNASYVAGLLGYEAHWSLPGWVIPVGISFYTFQTLSYSIDLYFRRIQPCASFRDFFLYVAFFPQLVAGPIVRARELLPQFRQRRKLRLASVQTGLYFVITGLFLKTVIADNLSPEVGRVFESLSLDTMSPVRVWIGVVYFGVQIFADFAGYSNIAVGLACLMGLRFPENFRYPYISAGLSEFWERWHITLSSWLRDYLYIPLGGNRKGELRTYVNLMTTMLLGGLWHGASWTFVVWGALHGLGLCVERVLRGKRPRLASVPTSLGTGVAHLGRILVTFVFVHLCWVFFRAQSFGTASTIVERMFVAPFREPLGLEHFADARHLVLVGAVFVMHVAQLAHEWTGRSKGAYLRAAYCGVLVFLLIIVRGQFGIEFIYFQF